MIKIILKVFSLFFLLFIGVELYWYYQNSGNLNILIQNHCNLDKSIGLHISLNKKTVFEKKIGLNESIPHEVNLKQNLGKYKLKVSKNSSPEDTTEIVRLFLVQWIVVGVYSDKIEISCHYIPPLLQ